MKKQENKSLPPSKRNGGSGGNEKSRAKDKHGFFLIVNVFPIPINVGSAKTKKILKS
jgi:hypothetical protein